MLNTLNKAAASMSRIKRLEALPAASAPFAASRLESTAGPVVTAHNLSFAYGDTMVLRSLSFTFTGPGLIALKGSSGTGKTTLLDLIAGLLAPTGGALQVSGAVAALPQDCFLFTGTISENVRMGRLDADDATVCSALSRAGAENLPADIDNGEGGAGLSGGQRQRVALARTILSDAPVWLLDEPTAALDADTERIIMETLEQERTKRLIIVSSHRRALLGMADTVLDLDKEGVAV
jgi:ABC-type transport system involved in cytochrome bd biosynthesis fused ATPase/permease subunit